MSNTQDFNTTDHSNTGDAPSVDRSVRYWARAVDRLVEREVKERFAAAGASRRDLRALNLIGLGAGAGEHQTAKLARGRRRLWSLADRGWISRSSEGSALGWKLTPAGEEARERLTQISRDVRAQLEGAVTPEAYATTVSTLETIARELGWEEGTRLPRSDRKHRGYGRNHQGHGRKCDGRQGHRGHQDHRGNQGYRGGQGHRGGQGYGCFGCDLSSLEDHRGHQQRGHMPHPGFDHSHDRGFGGRFGRGFERGDFRGDFRGEFRGQRPQTCDFGHEPRRGGRGASRDNMHHDRMCHRGLTHGGMTHAGMAHSGRAHRGMTHGGVNHEGMNHRDSHRGCRPAA